MGLAIFTLIHILISLAGIVSGLVVLGGWLAGKHYRGWTAFFLVTTAATSVTGFFFPFRGFTPAYAVGVISLFILAAAIYALYARQLSGVWSRVYIISAVTALYLNFFVLVAQLFQKTPALKELAALPENSRLEGTRTNPDRTAVCRLAERGIAAFCCLRHRRGASISSRESPRDSLKSVQGNAEGIA
jgi:hypothetical protein